jgi:hypothetical protein
VVVAQHIEEYLTQQAVIITQQLRSNIRAQSNRTK